MRVALNVRLGPLRIASYSYVLEYIAQSILLWCHDRIPGYYISLISAECVLTTILLYIE